MRKIQEIDLYKEKYYFFQMQALMLEEMLTSTSKHAVYGLL